VGIAHYLPPKKEWENNAQERRFYRVSYPCVPIVLTIGYCRYGIVGAAAVIFFFILCDLPRRGTEVVRLLNNPNFNDTTFTSFLKYRVTVVPCLDSSVTLRKHDSSSSYAGYVRLAPLTLYVRTYFNKQLHSSTTYTIKHHRIYNTYVRTGPFSIPYVLYYVRK